MRSHHLHRLPLARFILGRFTLGRFTLGRFTLGRFTLGRFTLGRFTLHCLLFLLLLNATLAPLYAGPHTESGLPLSLNPLDVPRQWVELVAAQVDQQGLDLPATARLTAYMMIALHEATLPAMGDGIGTATSLANHIPTMPALPQPKAGLAYDTPAVAIGALAAVTEQLLRTSLPTVAAQRVAQRNISSLYTTQSRLRLQSMPPAVMDRSLALGGAIGNAVATWAATDGALALANRPFAVPTGGADYWQPTTPTQAPVQPFWGALSGLVGATTDCTMPLQLPFATQPGSTFHQQALEVYHFVQKMTPHQAQVVDFWGYATKLPGNSHTRRSNGNAATRWLLIADQVAQTHNLALTDAAALYVPIALALHETTIVVWRTQYATFLLRPESYIHRWIDESWQPALAAPNTPAYPSAEAALGAAAAEALTAQLGIIAFVDQSRLRHAADRGRRFTSFDAAAYEHSMAALYAGITYRTAVESGLRQGRCVAQHVIAHLTAKTL